MPRIKADLLENSKMKEMQDLVSKKSPEDNLNTEDNEDRIKISDLRNLILLGRLVKEVNIGGFEFKISSLSANDQAEIVRALMKADDIDRILYSKVVALSYSIKEINSVPLSELSKESEGDNYIEKNMSFILDMQSTLVDKIFLEYEEIMKESSKEVGFDPVKK